MEKIIFFEKKNNKIKENYQFNVQERISVWWFHAMQFFFVLICLFVCFREVFLGVFECV